MTSTRTELEEWRIWLAQVREGAMARSVEAAARGDRQYQLRFSWLEREADMHELALAERLKEVE